jgi:AcrR family transcriptional regulator
MDQAPSQIRPLRADARENRDRILAVAGRLFTERGLDVPMAAIARHAGIGVATLYRRFPTREELVAAVFADQFHACASLVDDALADPDPWHGFRTFLEAVAGLQASDPGFSAAFLSSVPAAAPAEQDRERALRGFAELTARAQAAGGLRPDFVPDDLAIFLLAACGAAATPPEVAGPATRRLVGYLLAGLSADATGPLPPPAPLALRDLIH